MLRLEGKFPGEHIVETADELGIPLMYGWMCCNQWEKWPQWDDEDHRVAQDSLRSQIAMLRSHPSVFIWANGSDGRPPAGRAGEVPRHPVEICTGRTPIVDTVSSLATRRRRASATGTASRWRARTAGDHRRYWFSGRYARHPRVASAEQGDNEHIPPFASLKKFIPPDKLWPINDTWYFHAGSNPKQRRADQHPARDRPRATDRPTAPRSSRARPNWHTTSRRAPSSRHSPRNGWASHKMTIYWMLNNHWPSFFGNIFDYYLRPGGAYYGAKKGLRPLSVVFDSYATGDHTRRT